MLNEEKVLKFLKENAGVFNNKITKNFLSVHENIYILEKALVNNSKEAKNHLDEKFKDYYLRVKIVKYISKLIHFYTIDFDKRNNTRNKRFNLVLDAPIRKGGDVRVIDGFSDQKESEGYCFSEHETLSDLIESEEVYLAYQNLTDKQRKVLDLVYAQDLLNKEVAQLFGESSQNISNIRIRALNTLKKELTGGGISER